MRKRKDGIGYFGRTNVVCFLALLSTCLSSVDAAQSFRETPSDTTAVQNSTVTLKCSVNDRKGSVQWTRNGVALGSVRTIPGLPRYVMLGDDASGVFDLQISSVKLKSDDAVFECQVAPAGGDPAIKHSAKLSVQVPPSRVTIEGYHEGGRNLNNVPLANIPHTAKFLNLTCSAPGAKPAAELKWYYEGNPVAAGFLISTSVTKVQKTETAVSTIAISPRIGDNGKEFKCEASHPTWSAPKSNRVILNVLYPPSNPIITGYDSSTVKSTGDTITLTCTANGGNPLAQVHWYKNGKKIDYSFDSLAGKSVNEYEFIADGTDNKAVYRCEVSNSETPEPLTAQVTLDVYYTPEKVTISGHENAKAGDTITLSCATTPSNPGSSITWFTKGRQLSTRDVTYHSTPNGGTITISNVTITLIAADNQAEYHCHATNSKLGRTVQTSVTLDVYFPPPNPPIITGNDGSTVKAGSVKILTCQSFGGNPLATVTWWKGNTQVEGGVKKVYGNRAENKITLVLQASDNLADYRCNVTNAAMVTPHITNTTLHVIFHPSEVFVIPIPNPAKAGQPVNITCKSGSSNPASTLTWLKNGSPIGGGVDMGTMPDVYGGVASLSYLSIRPSAADDKMEYGCRASNREMGRSTEDAIKLDVTYPPIFDGIASSFVVTVGDNVLINMTTKANPVPSSYTWYKGAEKLKLKPMRRRRELELKHFTATGALLNITGVKKEDAADYFCEATNSEGTTKFKFQLDVQYPAVISAAVTPVMKSSGNNATLECQVDSNPAVDASMVSWSREGYDMSRATITFDSTKKASKLYIASVAKSDTGNFTCTANNKIGDAAVKNIELIIKYAPEIAKSVQYSKSAAEINDKGKVICRAEGAPPPVFTWSKKGVVLRGAKGTKYEIDRVKIDSVHYNSILTVYNVTWNDYSDYECIAKNELGQDTYTITLDGTSAPDPPTHIQFVNSTHNSITLKWLPGFDGGIEQSFMVRYRPTKGLSKGYTFVEAFHHIYTVTGLEHNTEYEITVRGHNPKGDSAFQEKGIVAKTAELPDPEEVKDGEEVPLVIILSVTIVGVLLLILNIFLIMFFIRRKRKNKMDKDSTDGSSQNNTIEMYSTSTGPAYPPSVDDTKSYTTYDKSIDDYPDEFGRPYDDDEDIKKVFLPPMDHYGTYGTYPSQTMDNSKIYFVNQGASTYLDDSVVGAPTNWPQPQVESPYKSSTLPRSPLSPGQYDEDIYADQLRRATKTMGSKPDVQKAAPPPPPVRSSSKGTIDVPKAMPPIPARNYAPTEIPRYTPAPGVLYGTAQRAPDRPSNGNLPGSEMRGALV